MLSWLKQFFQRGPVGPVTQPTLQRQQRAPQPPARGHADPESLAVATLAAAMVTLIH